MLKIGYISPDFRHHSVGYFIEPILSNHNKSLFKIFCYSDVLAPDHTTKRMRRYADVWHDISRLSDNDVFELIKQDNLHFLVDLAGHSGYNRLPAIARQPATVQITWIGYPNTTGLDAVHYRIVDNFTDPLGLTDSYNSEKLVRMPNCFLCFYPYIDMPDVSALPFLHNGYTTFASFNNLAKINDYTIKLWADVLSEVPNSRLIIKAKPLSDNAIREFTLKRFSLAGISAERLVLIGHLKGYKEHLQLYNQVDIALDTYPYNGTTTTFEALYMGVPVVTLRGSTHASRVGFSIVSNIQLDYLSALSADDFVAKAVALANDINIVKSLRESLRMKMQSSPLMDCIRFTKDYENKLMGLIR